MFLEEENLDWLALQYVIDDLSPLAREEFELRLLDSQELREAVARAVELSLACKAVCEALPTGASQTSPLLVNRGPAALAHQASASSRSRAPGGQTLCRRPTLRSSVGKVAAALAAVVVFGLSWQAAMHFLPVEWLRRDADQSRLDVAAQPESTFGVRDLALMWSQVQRTWTSEPLTDLEAEPILAELDAEALKDALEVVESDSAGRELEAPLWMVVAVSGLESGNESGLPLESAAPDLTDPLPSHLNSDSTPPGAGDDS